MSMSTCGECGSFVPVRVSACPECGLALVAAPAATRARKTLRGALALAGGSLFAMTLSACYGMAYPEPGPGDAGTPGDASATCDNPNDDLDGDGFCGDFDCDETDPDRHAGAFDEPGDELDADCGGTDAAD